MRRMLLVLVVCATTLTGLSAESANERPSSTELKEAPQRTEAESPELAEAQKLSLEVVRLFKAGNFDEATPLAKRVLQIRDKALPPGHDLINSALINLGEIYRARRKYGEAKPYFQRLLTNYEQASPSSPEAVASMLDVLAFLNYMEFEFDEAEKLYRRALTLREKAGESGKLATATSLFNLAEFYRLRGKYVEAEPFYQRAIEARESALGPDDKEMLKYLERYSCLYYSTNQLDKWDDVRKQFHFLREQDAASLDNGEILNGKAITLPKPVYPNLARKRPISGIVVIKIKIDEAGKVVGAEDMCAAHPALIAPSIQAAYKALFTPTLREGRPVQVTGVIVYKFAVR